MTLELAQQQLPTDKAVVGVCAGPDRTRYALCCNAMEQDASATSSPGSVVVSCPPDGTWQVLAQLPELSLRSVCCTGDGRLFACGMAGACVEINPATKEVARYATGTRDALWRVHGLRRDAVWAAGESALLRFDGSAFRAMDLEAALGPNAWPTLVDVHAAEGEVIAVGTQIEGACLLRVDGGGRLRAEAVEAHSLYACAALGGEDALAMGNDGAWRRSAAGWTRVVDLSGRDVRPFGRPGCIGLHRGQVAIASVDGVDVLKALLTDRPSLEGRVVNLWLGETHHRLGLGGKLGASALAFEGERLVIGLPGQVWDAPLPGDAHQRS
ncbi:MAG TPA: hypothetical protein VND93_31835 [Myxococcales bacterium]|nr:hypothetical protein [Myxococcales bacterium]